MVTEMTDNSGVDPGVNLLAKQSKDQTDARWDAKKQIRAARLILAFFFSHRTEPPLLSAPVLI